jgi:hypothetical protein
MIRLSHYLALPESGPVAAVNKEDDGVHGREVVLPHLHTGEIFVPVSVLWIRIRIQIQHFWPMRIRIQFRIQGFDDKKL